MSRNGVDISSLVTGHFPDFFYSVLLIRRLVLSVSCVCLLVICCICLCVCWQMSSTKSRWNICLVTVHGMHSGPVSQCSLLYSLSLQ